MNERIKDNLLVLRRDLNEALQNCTIRMMDACDDLEESIRAMDKIVDILSEHQQQAIYALVSSLLELESDEGTPIVPHKEIRRYVYEAATTFRDELLGNMSHNLTRNGRPDIMDANSRLRDELLEVIDENL